MMLEWDMWKKGEDEVKSVPTLVLVLFFFWFRRVRLYFVTFNIVDSCFDQKQLSCGRQCSCDEIFVS